ncbi:MAG TPA: hypothetical protein IAB83_10985 [Candidatus Faecousia faecavium]|nr:hypothetical protein [Candidatus Faecousia faecavium]
MEEPKITEHWIKFRPTSGGFLYDFEIAWSVSGIRCVLDQINRNRYDLVNVLPYDRDGYIIFFRRPAHG